MSWIKIEPTSFHVQPAHGDAGHYDEHGYFYIDHSTQWMTYIFCISTLNMAYHGMAYCKHIMAVIFTVQSRIIKINAQKVSNTIWRVSKDNMAVACYNSSDLTGYVLSDDLRLIHNEFCT